MRDRDWTFWSRADIPKVLEEPHLGHFLLEQRRNIVYAFRKAQKCCNHCGANQHLRKCGRCLCSYYCNVHCQRADWAAHKPVCVVANPYLIPLRNREYVLALPENEATTTYANDSSFHADVSCIGVHTVCEADFANHFGDGATLRTLLRLAIEGRPHPYMLLVSRGSHGEYIVATATE